MVTKKWSEKWGGREGGKTNFRTFRSEKDSVQYNAKVKKNKLCLNWKDGEEMFTRNRERESVCLRHIEGDKEIDGIVSDGQTNVTIEKGFSKT